MVQSRLRADRPPADGWQVGSRGTRGANVRFGPMKRRDRVERIRRERRPRLPTTWWRRLTLKKSRL